MSDSWNLSCTSRSQRCVLESPPVALPGTVLEELLAGFMLQSGGALSSHGVLQLGHVVV